MLQHSMIFDSDAAMAALFDGDIIDPRVRNMLPMLKTESFRYQLGEDDCQTLQEAGLACSLATHSASNNQVDFHAHASNKKPR